jgi:hypothetical protein
MDLILGFTRASETVEVERIAADHSTNEGSGRRANEHVGFIGMPTGCHLNSE